MLTIHASQSSYNYRFYSQSRARLVSRSWSRSVCAKRKQGGLLERMSYLLQYVRKGRPNEVSAVAAAARLFSVVEWQSRGHPHVHLLM